MSDILGDLIDARARRLAPPPNWSQRAEDELIRLRAEVARLEADAARWRILKARLYVTMRPNQSTWTIVETDQMFGEDKPVTDWEKQIDAARGAKT